MASAVVKKSSFSVRRQEAVLVAPAAPTPHELKPLSDIDDQEGLRFHIPVIQFYRNNIYNNVDPVPVIRHALAKALVFYYPFAGRLREGAHRKLYVDCTGEGVLFIEADADVRLDHLGDALQPPFPCMEDLLFDVQGSAGVLDCPLILVQVTRLLCGGFIFALRLNHTMSDAPGLVQFMTAIAELARGATAPTVHPVWARELLNARSPPRPTCAHPEYDQVPGTIIPFDDMVHRSFFFCAAEIDALRRRLPAHLRRSSTFEILTASLWWCRTAAIGAEAEEEVRIICIVNARGRLRLPQGYYGNAFAFPVAVSTAGKLCGNPLGYAVEQVRKAKSEVTEEYMQSVADLMVAEGRPHFTVVRSYLVSDVTRAGFMDVDFGWGKAVYGGPAKGGVVSSFFIPFNDARGDRGVLVPICLPAPAMKTFVEEMEGLLSLSSTALDDDEPNTTPFIKTSAL